MKDFNLESEIKALHVPKHRDEYWEAFPDRVLAELRAEPVAPVRTHSIMPELMWVARVAFACLMLGFCLWQSRAPRALSHVLLKDERAFRQSVARFDHNLSRFMQDEHGLHRLIEDQP